ncbi:MAG: peptide chain release factor N(5)-glutamine methyltransferase [Treponema sp.]
MTLFEAKSSAVKKLAGAGFLTPNLDADCLLQYLLKKDKTFILLNRDLPLSERELSDFNSLIERRLTGLPVAYITGTKEFFGIEFFVTPDVLIPKPDTEILVEYAVKKILDSEKNEICIADVCTGSGCIGLSVLFNVQGNTKDIAKKINLVMTDLSADALSVAEKNAGNIFPDFKEKNKIEFVQGDLLCGKAGFDFILSNPPYVPHCEVEKLLLDGRSEPRIALDGDIDFFVSSEKQKSDDGLAVIRRLVPLAYNALNDGGVFLMESGEYQAEDVRKLFCDAGFSETETLKDLSGQPRVTAGKKVQAKN